MRRGWFFSFFVLCLLAQAQGAADTVRRGAAITLKVPSFEQAETDLLNLVAKHHGVGADRKEVSSEGGRLSGWTRTEVPKEELDSFLSDLSQLGKTYGEKLSMGNESFLYEDLGKRAERLRQHEQRLSNMLTSRKGLRGSDVLFVQERLYRASTDEDTLSERREEVPAVASRSSVLVTFFEPAPVREQPRGVVGHVKVAVTDAFRTFAFNVLGDVGELLNLLVYAVVAAITWFIFRRPIRKGYGKLKDFVKKNGNLSGPEITPAQET